MAKIATLSMEYGVSLAVKIHERNRTLIINKFQRVSAYDIGARLLRPYVCARAF